MNIYRTVTPLLPAAPARPARRLRNWHKFAMTAGMTQAGAGLLVWEWWGLLTAIAALFIWLLTDAIIIALAQANGRL